ncbi:MAG: hypothetical protein OHK93_005226 [Ramalina farinacea]|uniref:Dynactin subunit 5 n=1 Tax=Ramalina farinacea TaxID=258253 RepID=A0AA43QW09_9LECA|nr:hypothetical protein [Ramalina farinacea]
MPPTAAAAAAQSKPKSSFIETDTGNKVSRRALLHGTQHIVLGGRVVIHPDVCIRGDLVRLAPPPSSSKPAAPSPAVTIGRYSHICQGTTLRPAPRVTPQGASVYVPLKIGDHTYVSRDCIIEAASVGDHVWIGRGAVIGKLCVIRDCVKILPGSVVPAGMVVGSGSIVGGRPARWVGELGEGWGSGGMEYVGEETAGGTAGSVGEGGDLRELWRGVG